MNSTAFHALVLRFPNDNSVGSVSIEGSNKEIQAIGNLIIPAGKTARLWLNDGLRNLDFLNDCDKESISSLRIGDVVDPICWDVISEKFSRLTQLKRGRPGFCVNGVSLLLRHSVFKLDGKPVQC